MKPANTITPTTPTNPDLQTPLAQILSTLTLARVVLNSARRFPYIVLTPLAAALGVPRSVVEEAMSLQWATGAISPFTGMYIDRVGRKRMMLLGMGSLAVLAGIAALGQSAGIILFVLAASGFTKVLYDPAMQAYIADRVPYARRGMAIGVTELSWSGSLLAIGPLAAFLLDRVGPAAIFAVIAIFSAVAFVLLLILIPADERSVAQPSASHQRGNLRELIASRPAVAMLVTGALISLAAESMNIAYEGWLRDAFALTTVALGTVSLVISAAEVGGEFFVIAISDRFGKRRLALVTLLGVGLVYFLLPFTAGSLPLAIAGIFLMFFTFETSIVVLIPLATEVLPHARGTMMSVNVAALAGGRAVGTLLGGWMLRTGGFAMNGTVALVLNLIAAVLVWRFVLEYTNAPQATPFPGPLE